MADAEHQRTFILADALFWIDCLAGIRGGNIVEQANHSRFRIHFDLHGSPTYLPKSRCRPQNCLGASLILVKSFPDDFSRLTAKEIDNYFTIGNAFAFA
jgi:hypothetical protein